MSSRVQKGNTIFRPVVKARSRTAGPSVSRQTSVISEPTSSTLLATRIPNSNLPILSEEPETIEPTQISSTTEEVITLQNSGPLDGFTRQTSLQPTRPAPSSILIIPSNNPTVFRGPTPVTVNTAQTHNDPSTNVIFIAQEEHSNENLAQETVLSYPSRSTISSARDVAAVGPAENLSQDAVEPLRKRRKTRKSADADGSPQRQRKRKSSTPGEDSESGRSRSRGGSHTPRRRKRAPSPPPFDPDAEPGEDIDPTAITMASICADTGQGRISSKAAEIVNNHAAWKAKNREKRAKMRVIMEAKKFGRTEEDVEAEEEAETAKGEASEQSGNEPPQPSTSVIQPVPSEPSNTAAPTGDSRNGFDYTENLATSRYNMQVRVGPNGEMIIDEDSLLVDRAENDGTENYTHVTESDFTKFVNSATYGKRFRGSRWSGEETELFYEALSQYGENYELIACVLPGRDRKACKNKFKAEDKKNPARINYCLNNSIPVDIKTLARMTGKDFSGPVPEIRVPPPPPPLRIDDNPDETNDAQANPPPNTIQTKKRNRNRNQGTDDAIIIVGNTEG